jgi:hypothetical protein
MPSPSILCPLIFHHFASPSFYQTLPPMGGGSMGCAGASNREIITVSRMAWKSNNKRRATRGDSQRPLV